MIARIFAAIPLLVASTATVLWLGSSPAIAGCEGGSTLVEVNASCSHGSRGAFPTGGGADGPSVFIYPVCAVKVGLICGRDLTCITASGQPGVMYHVTIGDEPQGQRCIAEAEANDAGVITPGQILTAMRRLDWPAPRLVIQPPDGLTLVNFDTNFYTTSTSPVTRRVTLLGQRITIEATPSEYHWDFGDGETLTTTDAGAPYPALDVTHNYRHKDTYRPRLARVRGRTYPEPSPSPARARRSAPSRPSRSSSATDPGFPQHAAKDLYSNISSID